MNRAKISGSTIVEAFKVKCDHANTVWEDRVRTLFDHCRILCANSPNESIFKHYLTQIVIIASCVIEEYTILLKGMLTRHIHVMRENPGHILAGKRGSFNDHERDWENSDCRLTVCSASGLDYYKEYNEISLNEWHVGHEERIKLSKFVNNLQSNCHSTIVHVLSSFQDRRKTDYHFRYTVLFSIVELVGDFDALRLLTDAYESGRNVLHEIETMVIQPPKNAPFFDQAAIIDRYVSSKTANSEQINSKNAAFKSRQEEKKKEEVALWDKIYWDNKMEEYYAEQKHLAHSKAKSVGTQTIVCRSFADYDTNDESLYWK